LCIFFKLWSILYSEQQQVFDILFMSFLFIDVDIAFLFSSGVFVISEESNSDSKTIFQLQSLLYIY